MIYTTRSIMGMPITIALGGDAAPDAVESAYEELARIDAVFSTFKPSSVISRLNRGEIGIDDCPEEVVTVLGLCRSYERESDGYFSAWFGGDLDPSGLVKGWAIDRAATVLEAAGCRHFCIEAGGDVCARGGREAGVPWRIGIRHPVERRRVARVVQGEDLAVATSGTYEKGLHIVDPHTGQPASAFVSLTVVGPDIVEADVLATTALCMGRRGLDFVAGHGGYEAFAIGPELDSWRTAGFDRHLVA